MNIQCSPAKSWLKEAEVAAITGISIYTLRRNRFLAKGISYSKVGKSVRYAIEDVESYMQANRINITGKY